MCHFFATTLELLTVDMKENINCDGMFTYVMFFDQIKQTEKKQKTNTRQKSNLPAPHCQLAKLRILIMLCVVCVFLLVFIFVVGFVIF